MAWNPNIPAVTNRVQDDLDAIRENFQHLDQLAERVDELQTVSELAERVDELQTVSELGELVDELKTVSELAPITNDLQTVSGLAQAVDELQTVSELASVVSELQTVSELAQITDDLQVVSALAPYAQALLDSRIVEMGSNANGEYARWENGLQLCWRLVNEGVQSFSQIQGGALYTVGGTSPQDFLWTYPATFAQPPIAIGSFHRPGVEDGLDAFVSIRTLGETSMLYRYYSVIGGNWTPRGLLIAIGRWK